MNEEYLAEDEGALRRACAAVSRDSNPAYVKDSELRYIAVNTAYAALWDTSPAMLIGRKSHQHFDAFEQNDRDEKERRSLVFGKDQVALFAHPLQGGRYRIRVRRQRQEGGKAFIAGHFETIPGIRFERGNAPGSAAPDATPLNAARAANESTSETVNATDREAAALRGDYDMLKAAMERTPQPIGVFDATGRVLVESPSYGACRNFDDVDLPGGGRMRIGRQFRPASTITPPLVPSLETPFGSPGIQAGEDEVALRLHDALDCMDIGTVIYDPEDVLVYVNPAMRSMVTGAFDMPLGTGMADILRAAWKPGEDGDISNREQWISGHVAAQHEYGVVRVEKLSNGRWMRMVNHRLADGSTLGLRIDVSDLMEHERELGEKLVENSLYLAVLDALPVPTFIKDGEFRYVYVNRALADMAGYAATEMLGKTDFHLFGRQSKATRRSDKEVMDSGEAAEVEITMKREDGAPLTLLNSKARFHTPKGQTYLLGSTVDISAIKQREADVLAARQVAEQHRSDLESTLDAMPMGVIVVDRTLKIELANDAFFRIWRLPPRDNIIGESFETLLSDNRQTCQRDVSEAKWPEYLEAQKAEIANGYVEPVEMERQDGCTVIYSVRPLSHGKRMLSYYDITERKRHETELVKARREVEAAGTMMQAASGAMAQGLFIVVDGNIEFTNEKFREMLDIPVEVVAPGKHWTSFLDFCMERGDYDSGDREAIRQSITECMENGIGYTVERQMRTDHWLRIDALPTENRTMVVTYTDVTEAKNREVQLNELLGKAEIADRAKSEFLANMSHEIRTPMNGVLGMAELLSRTDLDSRQRTFADIIVKSGTALLTIINDILDFSKIDAGQMVLDEAPFDLRETIEDVATLVSTRAVEKDVELIVRIDPALEARVVGDVGRVRQIVTNMAGNAVKFTETGHVLIELSGIEKPGGVLAATIRVEDTGIGIPGDKIDVIFDKFSQVDNSSTRRHEGTGLGLAITSRLVELMGGSIRAESASGQGAVFTVVIDFPVERAFSKPKPLPVDVTGARILIIDDNSVNRAILSEQLSCWGFDVCAAESGVEGERVLEIARRHGIAVDAIILDYHMPERNGVTVCQSIRANYPAADLPVIMLTSMDIRGAETGISNIDVQATLMKPARSSLLLETLVQVLQAKAGRDRKPNSDLLAQTEPGFAVDIAADEKITPAVTPSGKTVELQAGHGEQIPGLSGSSGSLDILVAEDNEVNQIVFTQILEDLGLRYRIVDNGGSAVEVWRRGRPALILMDVSMPVLNGHQATEAIREAESAEPTLGHTPIVGVTAHALTGDQERCLEAGMDDYLSKPISPEKLEAKIRDWLPEDVASRIVGY